MKIGIAEKDRDDDSKKKSELIIGLSENRSEASIDVFDFDMKPVEISSEEELNEKVIGNIEKQVRSSFEYYGYLRYLKEELNLTKCALIPELDIKDTQFSLEFHHFPMNLFEITDTIARSMIAELKDGESVSNFDIAERVVKEHYLNNIGLIPLTKTLHEMAHNKAIIIPIDKINGNYKEFIAKYKDFVLDEIKDRVRDVEFDSTTDESLAFNQEKLRKHITDLNVEYLDHEEEKDDDSSEQ